MPDAVGHLAEVGLLDDVVAGAEFSARCEMASPSRLVSMITLVSGWSRWDLPEASRPSLFGMSTSSSTTSGCREPVSTTASAPSRAHLLDRCRLRARTRPGRGCGARLCRRDRTLTVIAPSCRPRTFPNCGFAVCRTGYALGAPRLIRLARGIARDRPYLEGYLGLCLVACGAREAARPVGAEASPSRSALTTYVAARAPCRPSSTRPQPPRR